MASKHRLHPYIILSIARNSLWIKIQDDSHAVLSETLLLPMDTSLLDCWHVGVDMGISRELDG